MTYFGILKLHTGLCAFGWAAQLAAQGVSIPDPIGPDPYFAMQPEIARANKPAQPAVRLTFTSSPERRARNMAKIADRIIGVNPTQAMQLRAQITPALISQFETSMPRQGLNSRNIADSVALYLAAAWQVSHGVHESSDIAPATLRALSTQVAGWIQKTPGMATLDNAQKQAMVEELLVQTYMLASSSNAAGDDPHLRAKVQADALQNAKAQGFDLKALALTPTGFVSAK